MNLFETPSLKKQNKTLIEESMALLSAKMMQVKQNIDHSFSLVENSRVEPQKQINPCGQIARRREKPVRYRSSQYQISSQNLIHQRSLAEFEDDCVCIPWKCGGH